MLAQEAAHLSQAYHQVVLEQGFTSLTPKPSQVLVAMQQAQDYVPFSWLSLVQVHKQGISNATNHGSPCAGETGTLSSPCRPARGSEPSLH